MPEEPLKSTETVLPVHAKQLKTYLVLTRKTVGLLLNFGMDLMKTGIRRVVIGDAPDLRVSVPPCENSTVTMHDGRKKPIGKEKNDDE